MHICSIFKWENYYNSADFFKWEVRFQKAAIKKAQNQQISLPKTLYSKQLNAPMFRF